MDKHYRLEEAFAILKAINFSTKRPDGKFDHFEVLDTKRNTDDGDAQHDAPENMINHDPNTAKN